MLNCSVNIWGILIVTVVNFILAGVYFGVLIAKPYKVAMGRENEPDKKPGLITIVGPMICNLVMTITVAILIRSLNIHSFADALPFGLLIGFGYQVPMTMMIAINPNFPRPFFYTAINAPYFLISSVMASTILTAMG